jgi:pilus assembly protein Flp/PilA
MGAGLEGNGKMRVLKALLREERGATAIEYGLIAALIAIAAIAAFQRLGLNLAAIFETVLAALRG